MPLIQLSSLTATGRPSSAPTRPRRALAYLASALRAAANASSKWVKVKAFTFLFTFSARPITAFISSTGDSLRARNRDSASVALI